ncbi:multidrug effflux MFS transporter [Jongsikchunia kroppenstedtii]|uniref:multidrug effflux MFS transporter n=1 Tax=Jongsikchunia kroppenstedtii TaxID=1121721 RepID=UPI00036F17CA|nr:multidrug effflux MFS transporter [Jongsikchunia kroppenstedtii]
MNRPGSRIRLIGLLGALSAFGPITTDVYLPGLPQAAKDLHVSSSSIQLTLTTCLVGLALGQLLVGPLSDRWGRRRPMIAGMAVFAVASALCAIAPNVYLLDLFRLLQGVAGAAGIVVAMAIVRDLYSGTEAARSYSILLAVNGIAPIASPVVGAQLLRVMDWRGLFVVLAGLGVVFLLAAVVAVPETLPVERRRTGEVADMFRNVRHLFVDRSFMGYALAGGLSFAAMFAYISASAFVFQDVYGTSAQQFSAFFAVNAIGILLGNAANTRLVRRWSPQVGLNIGLAGVFIGAAATFVVTTAGLGIWYLEPALFVMVASIGLTMPNATALALEDHGDAAGAASAGVGLLQFGLGALAAPLVGIGGSHSAVPMGIVTVVAAVLALVARVALGRSRRAI